MTEEKIKTVMLAGGVNKFSIYGKEFWTIPEAQAYAREVESIDWTPVAGKDEEYGNGYCQQLAGKDKDGNEWYGIGIYCFDELQRIEEINKYCPHCKGEGMVASGVVHPQTFDKEILDCEDCKGTGIENRI
jgi:hypothetical protein